MKPKAPILFATDFSSASRPALKEAVRLGKEGRTEVVITHVLSPPEPANTEAVVFPQLYEQLETVLRSQATRKLSALVGKAKKRGVKVETVLVRGVPHEEILRVARARKARLIVMGTHGRTGLSRWLIGSVASRVTAGASSPVLVVPGR